MARRQPRQARGAPYDLFGEIPVTLAEVLQWMLAVPGIPPTSPRFGHYVRTYDVIGKIRAAKAAGTLDAQLHDQATPASLPHRLASAIDAASTESRRWRQDPQLRY